MAKPELEQELNRSLLDHLSISTKRYIVDQLWNHNLRQTLDSSCDITFSAYWEYYARQCRQALHDNGRHISARNHRDILDIAKFLKNNCSRQEIRWYLQSTLSNAAASNSYSLLNRSIELTASLLLMVDFGDHINGFNGHTQLKWNDSSSLEDFISCYFSQPPILGNEGVKLQRIFNARSLERIAGLKIIWTNNLADHLRLTDDDRTVEIFHQATFLEAQRER
jgi:hypothetical protein